MKRGGWSFVERGSLLCGQHQISLNILILWSKKSPSMNFKRNWKKLSALLNSTFWICFAIVQDMLFYVPNYWIQENMKDLKEAISENKVFAGFNDLDTSKLWSDCRNIIERPFFAKLKMEILCLEVRNRNSLPNYL